MPGISREILSEILLPHCFFVSSHLQLQIRETAEERIPWETHRGRLLPTSHCRAHRHFFGQQVYLSAAGPDIEEPLLSVYFDEEKQEFHIVRWLQRWMQQPRQLENNVIVTEEKLGRERELVATVKLGDFSNTTEIREELGTLLFQAVIGISRLPVTSIESPLPEYSLGVFGYFPQLTSNNNGPMNDCFELISALYHSIARPQKIKLLELLLRAASPAELNDITAALSNRWRQLGQPFAELPALLRELVNEASLSPWTDFAGNLLHFVRVLADCGQISVTQRIDFLGYLLRQLGRHLTAYDLITFHNRGANYPDALLLDMLMKEYLALAAWHSELFLAQPADNKQLLTKKQTRRRALRQGWLFRRFYEGLPVPDAPTSPGEITRVLPPPHNRIPEEQVLQTTKRRKQLFADDSLEKYLQPPADFVLHAAVRDLIQPQEMYELGLAVFIDRPLGIAKAPGEPDRTLLFSHQAFSRSIAGRRIELLKEYVPDTANHSWDEFHTCLVERTRIHGLPANLWRNDRRGVVSLADAALAAEDFLFVRTTPTTVREFVRQYGIERLARQIDIGFLVEGKQSLIVPEPMRDTTDYPVWAVYDDEMTKRLRFAVDLSNGYRMRGGREYPAAGLRALIAPDEN